MAPRIQRDVRVGGVRLRVVEAGEGAPVLLLHGVFHDHTVWDSVMEELSSEFRVIAPDLPGFGASEKPLAKRFSYEIDRFAESVVDLYGALDLGPTALIGHALGGAVALAIAAQRPELVSRLMLVDAQCHSGPTDWPLRVALIPVVGALLFKQLLGRTAFRAFYRDRMLGPNARVSTARIDHYFDEFNVPPGRDSALATLRATRDGRALVARTTRVRVPTLVAWGRHDRICPAGLGQRLAREIPQAGFELLDAGHCPHEEHPAALAATARRFLLDQRPSQV